MNIEQRLAAIEQHIRNLLPDWKITDPHSQDSGWYIRAISPEGVQLKVYPASDPNNRRWELFAAETYRPAKDDCPAYTSGANVVAKGQFWNGDAPDLMVQTDGWSGRGWVHGLASDAITHASQFDIEDWRAQLEGKRSAAIMARQDHDARVASVFLDMHDHPPAEVDVHLGIHGLRLSKGFAQLYIESWFHYSEGQVTSRARANPQNTLSTPEAMRDLADLLGLAAEITERIQVSQ